MTSPALFTIGRDCLSLQLLDYEKNDREWILCQLRFSMDTFILRTEISIYHTELRAIHNIFRKVQQSQKTESFTHLEEEFGMDIMPIDAQNYSISGWIRADGTFRDDNDNNTLVINFSFQTDGDRLQKSISELEQLLPDWP